VVCSGCEGHPVFPNVPCAVCGASPVVPVGVSREEIDIDSGRVRTAVVNILERHITGWGGEYAENPYDAAPVIVRDILAALRPTDTGWRDIAANHASIDDPKTE